MLYRDQGVVLRSIKLGETDRIVTILTRGQGKVRGVVKGVRKPGSRFGPRLEPTSHVMLQCYRGRSELDVVTQVETIDANRGLREHYGCLTHAVSMLEATDQVAQDREPNPALYRMLVGALRTLAADPSPLVERGVLLEAALARGLPPDARRVRPRCGTESAPFPAFDLFEGGVLCEPCGRLGGRRLPSESLTLLRQILGGELRSALAEPPSATTVDVERLALAALEHHLERRLRSAALL